MTRLVPTFILLFCGSCAGGAEDDGYVPTLHCPGDPSGVCDDNDGRLSAGAASVSVVPACWEEWTDIDGDVQYHKNDDTFRDCGCDRLCPGDPGYTAPDAGEGDETLQTAWVAGFQSARAMSGVRGADLGLLPGDGLFARALVLRKGATSLAIVSVDGFGWMNDQVQWIREELAAASVDVDHVVLGSSHTHNSPDSLGIYGRSVTISGFDPAYAAQVREAVVSAVTDAATHAVPVALVAGSVDISTYSDKGVANFVGDSRDPWVVDPMLNAAQFVADDGTTVASLVNWANHPESTGGDYALLSSGYAHGVRHTLEQGSDWEAYHRDGLGGVGIFIQGALGGMMTPLHIAVDDPDGNTWAEKSFEKSDALGILVGEMALDALEQGTRVDVPELAFRMQELYLPIDNVGFQAMFLVGVLDRQTYNWNPDLAMSDDNAPEIKSEVDILQIGPIQILTVPGELLPELAVGGYDGSMIHAPGMPLIDPGNPNPPDVSQAPAGPYLKDRLTADYRWVVGLGNDQVGYIVPEYDFEVDLSAPYIFEADGDHYEETNSLGPRTAGLIDQAVAELAGWAPAE